ncbi:hypothetical protein L208DRAFT_502395 [Tricholoma matsutake]|nr:hypothetical protein L208DRAFT_502395 [Tricholoma matsutake 945]
MSPTTAKPRCAALHTEPPVDKFFTSLKSAEMTAEPRILPDFRPRAAARKRQNKLPEPSEHPQTLSQPQFESPSLCRITRIHMHHYRFFSLLSPQSCPGLSPSRARAEPEPATRARLAMY